MARRPKFTLRRAERGVDLPPADQTSTLELNYLPDFLQYGSISIGHIEPVGGVATASEGKRAYVTLRRKPGETLHQTIVRLDLAIGRVINELVYIDEINPHF
jgi:hypothetical protein